MNRQELFVSSVLALRMATAVFGAMFAGLLTHAIWKRRHDLTAAERVLSAMLLIYSVNLTIFVSVLIINHAPNGGASYLFLGDLVTLMLGLRLLYLSREDEDVR